MYIAEIKGKLSPKDEKREDILTSNVFSFFKYANREIFLYQFITLLGLAITPSEAHNAEFVFWTTYEDGTEPDLVIIVGEYYLLIEAKLNSSFGIGADSTKHQLVREHKGGSLEARNLGKTFVLIACTAHYSKHHFKKEISDVSLSNIIWINWHQIAMLIYTIIDKSKKIGIETLSFAEDLYNLLVKKKLRKYAGQEAFVDLNPINEVPLQLFFDPFTAKYRGDFIGFFNILNNQPKIKPVLNIFLHQQRELFSFQSRYISPILPVPIFMKELNNE